MQDEKLRTIIEASKMYYQLDYSQQEIAKKLGISRPTVSRYLQQAKEEGIVQIKINDPAEDCNILAIQLKERFGLRDVFIVGIPQYEDHIVKKYIGKEAAHYLYCHVKDRDIIATTWGTTMYQVAKQLQMKHVKEVKVVQLNGGVSHSEKNTYASEIIHMFGKAFNTYPHFLPLPAIVDHILVKQAIEADRHIHSVLELGRQANIAIFTVGSPLPSSLLIQTKYFSDDVLEMIYKEAAGDICSRYFDRFGNICDESLNQRTIGIDLSELKAKEKSILVAGGVNKIDAIAGALAGGYANVLITDQFTATALMENAG